MSVDTKRARVLSDSNWRLSVSNESRDMLRDLADEVDRLREFAAYVMGDVWEHNEPDGGSIQDKAEALGLIELCPIDSEDSIDGETEHYFLSWAKP